MLISNGETHKETQEKLAKTRVYFPKNMGMSEIDAAVILSSVLGFEVSRRSLCDTGGFASGVQAEVGSHGNKVYYFYGENGRIDADVQVLTLNQVISIYNHMVETGQIEDVVNLTKETKNDFRKMKVKVYFPDSCSDAIRLEILNSMRKVFNVKEDQVSTQIIDFPIGAHIANDEYGLRSGYFAKDSVIDECSSYVTFTLDQISLFSRIFFDTPETVFGDNLIGEYDTASSSDCNTEHLLDLTAEPYFSGVPYKESSRNAESLPHQLRVYSTNPEHVQKVCALYYDDEHTEYRIEFNEKSVGFFVYVSDESGNIHYGRIQCGDPIDRCKEYITLSPMYIDMMGKFKERKPEQPIDKAMNIFDCDEDLPEILKEFPDIKILEKPCLDFDLDKVDKGAEVETKSGLQARILEDRLSSTDFPLIFAINENGSEFCQAYSKDGEAKGDNRDLDLMMSQRIYTGYLIVYSIGGIIKPVIRDNCEKTLSYIKDKNASLLSIKRLWWYR